MEGAVRMEKSAEWLPLIEMGRVSVRDAEPVLVMVKVLTTLPPATGVDPNAEWLPRAGVVLPDVIPDPLPLTAISGAGGGEEVWFAAVLVAVEGIGLLPKAPLLVGET